MPERVSRWVLDNFSETFDLWVASEQQHAARCDSLATSSLPL